MGSSWGFLIAAITVFVAVSGRKFFVRWLLSTKFFYAPILFPDNIPSPTTIIRSSDSGIRYASVVPHPKLQSILDELNVTCSKLVPEDLCTRYETIIKETITLRINHELLGHLLPEINIKIIDSREYPKVGMLGKIDAYSSSITLTSIVFIDNLWVSSSTIAEQLSRMVINKNMKILKANGMFKWKEYVNLLNKDYENVLVLLNRVEEWYNKQNSDYHSIEFQNLEEEVVSSSYPTEFNRRQDSRKNTNHVYAETLQNHFHDINIEYYEGHTSDFEPISHMVDGVRPYSVPDSLYPVYIIRDHVKCDRGDDICSTFLFRYPPEGNINNKIKNFKHQIKHAYDFIFKATDEADRGSDHLNDYQVNELIKYTEFGYVVDSLPQQIKYLFFPKYCKYMTTNLLNLTRNYCQH